ncbi:hypothetical protein FH972_025598 [Carpinus fangiana]|uniref:Uncharacterized protein n=1 Tax=Carpinus fangiana TaxID=176857 RepID=A0A5N6L1R8_9ROSI|nr:hypothetical protein FH972_025598 [Carpinus fangiana]
MPSRPRFFANDQPISSRNPTKQLIASLERLVKDYPPASVSPGGGLYYGPISIAYLFFTLQQFYKDFTIEDIPMGTWMAVYLKTAEDAMKDYPGPTNLKCGVSDDIMALIALSAASAKDPDMARDLCDFAGVVTEPNANNEWLYGRAGFLYLLRLVRASFQDDDEVKEMLDDTADEVIDCILDSPRPFKWHDKAYVGAVHGTVGIITQIVLTDPTYAKQLEPELLATLSYQYESGNWPSSVPAGDDKLVQFCHGAPGVVSSLVSIKHYFPDIEDRLDEYIKTGRAVIKERGLLTKEPGLCHGISGNALALEEPDFEHFLTYTTASEMKALENDGMMERAEDPSSLYTGEAGRAWAWAVMDKHLERRFIGYNDI